MAAIGASGSRSDHQLKVGLINSSNKFLTAESFGFKVNASGTSLKKKQTFILEQDAQEEVVYVKSHTGRYMAADKYGNVTCDSEERGQMEKFAIEYDKNGSGRWAFKNINHGNYLGGSDDNLKCFSKSVKDTELWQVQMAIHPQVNLLNINRRRYAHLINDELQVTEVIPWGQEALIILHYDNGKYAIKTYDNRFLSRDGTLITDLNDNSRFTLEIKSGANSGFAFKDCVGEYLTAVGATATMKSRNKTVTKDELFKIEDSCPQIILTSLANNKKVSIKQGVDVTANQDEVEHTNHDIFQMELVAPETDSSPAKWAFRTVNNDCWIQEPLGGIQARAKDNNNPNAQFVVEWLGDGTISLKANNKHYIQSRQTGQLMAVSDSVTNKEKFYPRIINRPLLLLRNEYGFVGLRSTSKPEVMCSRANYEIIYVEPSNDGHYFLKGTNNKYWRLADDASIISDGDSPEPFQLEPRSSSVLTIKGINGCYIKGEQNGLFRAIGHEVDHTVLWEY
uniref:Fascin n=1 Tax=Arion vulgaris TaxID=1028688 RepID=A0A0B6ZSM2_9EUPU